MYACTEQPATTDAFLRLLLRSLLLLLLLLLEVSLELLLWLQCLQWESGIQRARRLRCFLFFPSPIPPFLPLRPFLSRAFPARLSLLLATLFRRPRAVRRCGPLSIRTHQASLHHVMCPFDTSLSSCIEFVSFFSSTHFSCVVISSRALPGPQLLFSLACSS